MKKYCKCRKASSPLLAVYIQVWCVWVKPQSWHFLLHITWEKILISICAEPVLTCRKLQGLCSFHKNESEIDFRFKITKLWKNAFVFAEELQSNHFKPCALSASKPEIFPWLDLSSHFLLSWRLKGFFLAIFLEFFIMPQTETACQLKIGLASLSKVNSESWAKRFAVCTLKFEIL